ncbi:putative 30S ribosomal protein S1, chloroplastic [Sesbania bispinosa]|nr:putative 30S ribosomal protein S1, chloroplastic [Sesbania bispinosa]
MVMGMGMASVAQQLSGVWWSAVLWRPTQKQRRGVLPIVCSVALANAQNKERLKLKELFKEAYERCRTAPMEGVSFTLKQFTSTLDKYDFDAEIGTKASSFLSLLLIAKLS